MVDVMHVSVILLFNVHNNIILVNFKEDLNQSYNEKGKERNRTI